MTTEKHVKLIMDTFRGRPDVVAKYFYSIKTGAKGYAPICRNQWKKGVCNKPCRLCQNSEYVPLSDKLIRAHFDGTFILGIYSF